MQTNRELYSRVAARRYTPLQRRRKFKVSKQIDPNFDWSEEVPPAEIEALKKRQDSSRPAAPNLSPNEALCTPQQTGRKSAVPEQIDPDFDQGEQVPSAEIKALKERQESPRPAAPDLSPAAPDLGPDEVPRTSRSGVSVRKGHWSVGPDTFPRRKSAPPRVSCTPSQNANARQKSPPDIETLQKMPEDVLGKTLSDLSECDMARILERMVVAKSEMRATVPSRGRENIDWDEDSTKHKTRWGRIFRCFPTTSQVVLGWRTYYLFNRFAFYIHPFESNRRLLLFERYLRRFGVDPRQMSIRILPNLSGPQQTPGTRQQPDRPLGIKGSQFEQMMKWSRAVHAPLEDEYSNVWILELSDVLDRTNLPDPRTTAPNRLRGHGVMLSVALTIARWCRNAGISWEQCEQLIMLATLVKLEARDIQQNYAEQWLDDAARIIPGMRGCARGARSRGDSGVEV